MARPFSVFTPPVISISAACPCAPRAALWGLWLGLALVLVWRPAEAGSSLPLLGAGLAPFAWAGWQWFVYRMVTDDPRVRDANGC